MRDTKEVLTSAINFLYHRGDDTWRALAQEAFVKFPDGKHFKQRAAEASLDHVISSQRYELGGTLTESVDSAEVSDALSILK